MKKSAFFPGDLVLFDHGAMVFVIAVKAIRPNAAARYNINVTTFHIKFNEIFTNWWDNYIKDNETVVR